MIKALNLSKRYGSLEAVRELNFDILQGEIVGLLGPNGAGKTTTMRMLTTFLPPSSGAAIVGGFDICTEGAEVRKHLGYLPENPPLYPELKVSEYLKFVAEIKDVPRQRIRSAVDDVIAQCGLSNVYRRLCGELSKGFRQRVGIAQALVHRPNVIILDEPTSGLDPTQIIEIRALIAGLRGAHTVILSTHILPEVIQTCSKVIIIAGGRIVVEGALSEITVERSLEERFLEAVSRDIEGV